MNPERFQFLLSAYLDGALLPGEKDELEGALRTSAAFRAHFWSQSQIHHQLRTVFAESEAVLSHPDEIDQRDLSAERRPSPFHPVALVLALFQRPMTALATGVVISALCTSMLWAYAGQHLVPRGKSIPLLNASFEDTPSLAPLGVPREPNVWSGDYTALTGPDQGVLPRSGKTMLRFLRADNALPPKSPTHHIAEAIHLIDLRFLRSEIQAGHTHLDICGWFASVSPQPHVRFLVKAATFCGDPLDAPSVWEECSRTGLSMVQSQVEPSPTPGQWTPLSVSIPVSVSADFLVFECAAIQVHPAILEGSAEFAGQYLDDVTVHLRRDGSKPGAADKNLTP